MREWYWAGEGGREGQTGQGAAGLGGVPVWGGGWSWDAGKFIHPCLDFHVRRMLQEWRSVYRLDLLTCLACKCGSHVCWAMKQSAAGLHYYCSLRGCTTRINKLILRFSLDISGGILGWGAYWGARDDLKLNSFRFWDRWLGKEVPIPKTEVPNSWGFMPLLWHKLCQLGSGKMCAETADEGRNIHTVYEWKVVAVKTCWNT